MTDGCFWHVELGGFCSGSCRRSPETFTFSSPLLKTDPITDFDQWECEQLCLKGNATRHCEASYLAGICFYFNEETAFDIHKQHKTFEKISSTEGWTFSCYDVIAPTRSPTQNPSNSGPSADPSVVPSQRPTTIFPTVSPTKTPSTVIIIVMYNGSGGRGTALLHVKSSWGIQRGRGYKCAFF